MRVVLQSLALAIVLQSAVAQETRLLDTSFEWMRSDDIQIQSAWAAAQSGILENSSLTGRLDYMRQTVDYRPNEPIDPFGEPVNLEEHLTGAQVDFENVRGRHQFSASASVYEGFRNPSSIWIDRYYQQQYGQGGLPGVTYEIPDPKGIGTTLTYRLEVIPTAGYLSISLGYLRDEVAPGYEIEDLGNAFELVKSEERLHTWTGSLEWEGVINGRARTRQSIRITETTARDVRVSWNGGLNVLLADRWISRTEANYAREDPGFKATSISQSLELRLSPTWSLALTLRYYEDTGQIETANLISSAAPELSSRQAFLSLRYLAADQVSGFSFSIGPYATDYGPTGIGTERFVNLYQDRDWIWTRLAGRMSF